MKSKAHSKNSTNSNGSSSSSAQQSAQSSESDTDDSGMDSSGKCSLVLYYPQSTILNYNLDDLKFLFHLFQYLATMRHSG